jgi:8-oxo-dGDP phosphatase
MKWKTYGERRIYREESVNACLLDVRHGRRRHDHHVRLPRQPYMAAVLNDRWETLMTRRHRLITGSWDWEPPTGLIDRGQTPIRTAAGEAEEAA